MVAIVGGAVLLGMALGVLEILGIMRLVARSVER